MILEAIGISALMSGLMIGSGVKWGTMSDKKKIEKILDYTKTFVVNEKKEVKKCVFVRKEDILNDEEKEIGTKYVYRLPFGLPHKKLEFLNNNIGVFEDGLHKNVEFEWDGGMMHLNVYEIEIPKKWNYRLKPTEGWKVPVGKTYKGLVWHDFDQTPNLVGGGSVRYGKTNFMKGIITSLILSNPNDVELYLIDLKAGVEFSRYENIQQVNDVATNVGQTYQLLHEVCNRLEAKQAQAREEGWNNIVETKDNKRVFVIIDEAGDLTPEKFMEPKEKKMYEACQWMLAHIARIGGAFGFRELFFSQYTTADVLPRQIKQNADAKICFKIQNEYASEVILGEKNGDAADLPKIRGRAIWKDGPDLLEMQVPLISNRVMEHYLKRWRVERGNGGEEGRTTTLEFKSAEGDES